MASSTIFCIPASVKSRVFALADFWPMRTVTVSCRSYCTRLVVIDEFAQRVPDRSPPVRFTSTASALAMLRTLSTIALASSRVYIGGGGYEPGCEGVKTICALRRAFVETRQRLAQARATTKQPVCAEREREGKDPPRGAHGVPALEPPDWLDDARERVAELIEMRRGNHFAARGRGDCLEQIEVAGSCVG